MLKRGTVVYTTADEYTIDQQIGQGGNGTIYRVRSSEHQLYALKAIDRDRTSQNKLKRFKNELEFCQNYSFKNIIRVLDSGTYKSESENIVFYIMPLYNMTLRKKMSLGLRYDEILPIILQLLEGVKFAHQKQVWHRDIKPENVFIADDGNVVLADFGIAHFSTEEIATAVETKSSERLCNFTYAAPEQKVHDLNVDGRADIYAIGLILNELFTGAVIAGSNYKTIKSVSKEFAYLDDIVSLMIDQDKTKRLYPIERVALQIAAAQRQSKDNENLLSLMSPSQKPGSEFCEMSIPNIIEVDYRNETLFLYIKDLDYQNHMIWSEVLRNGNYSHRNISKYTPSELKIVDNNVITIFIPTRDAYLAQDIAKYIREWFAPATALFNANQRAVAEAKTREEERKIRDQIEVLRAEEKARNNLKASFASNN